MKTSLDSINKNLNNYYDEKTLQRQRKCALRWGSVTVLLLVLSYEPFFSLAAGVTLRMLSFVLWLLPSWMQPPIAILLMLQQAGDQGLRWISTVIFFLCQQGGWEWESDSVQEERDAIVSFVQMALAAWSAVWLLSFMLSYLPSSSSARARALLSARQCHLLGLDSREAGSRVAGVRGNSSNIQGGEKNVGRGLASGGAMTDFCYDQPAPPSSNGKSRQYQEQPRTMHPPSSAASENSKKHAQASKPSVYSNFLLSAVTSPGCHRQQRRHSMSPSGHGTSPHLHNHAGSSCGGRRNQHSTYREGENFASITATRTDYISPQSDRTNFRSRRGRGKSASLTPSTSSSVASPDPHLAVQRLLTPPPRLPDNSSLRAIGGGMGSSLVSPPGSGGRPDWGRSRTSPGVALRSAGGVLAPPDQQQRYDPTPTLASERMQFLVENRDYYESKSDFKSPGRPHLLVPASITGGRPSGGRSRLSLRLTMARHDIVSTPIFQYFRLSEEPGGALDLERYTSNLRITLAIRLQEHLKNFDYYVDQLTRLLKQNGLIQSTHHADAVTNMLKMKKHARVEVQGQHISSAEDLLRFLGGLDRTPPHGLREAHPGELDSVVQAYVALLSLFVQPLESRQAARRMQRRQQQQSVDSLGRERDRDLFRDGDRDSDRGRGRDGGEPSFREKVLAADVLRICRHQTYDVRCVMDRCLQLAKDSHLGRFVWDANGYENSSSAGRRQGGTELDSFVSDSELVMALFLHLCDARRAEQDLRQYSGGHFFVDLLAPEAEEASYQGKASTGLVPVLQQPQQQQHQHHHHKMAANKNRFIDFPAASGGEACVLLAMRATSPAHFNIYLLNHHASRRNRQQQGYMSGPAFEGGAGMSNGDALKSHLQKQEEHTAASTQSPSATNPKNGGNFDFLSSGFQGLPVSVDADQKQQKQSRFPYSTGGHGSSGAAGSHGSKAAVEELFVPEGRHNVFLAILFFLITSQAASSVSGGPSSSATGTSEHGKAGQGQGQLEGALRDLAVDVFGAARVPGHLSLPQ